MNDFIVSLIRTYVPIGVGAVVSVLVANGVDISAETQVQVVAGLTAVVSALYYWVARLLEQKYPAAGWLLGSKKQPTYKK